MHVYTVLVENDYIGIESPRILGTFSNFETAKKIAKKWLKINLDSTHVKIYKAVVDGLSDDVLDEVVLVDDYDNQVREVIVDEKHIDTWTFIDNLNSVKLIYSRDT